ncbi:MAG: B12-binding domain-containing radical SAM protein [Syntrophobacteraceae bacterium]
MLLIHPPVVRPCEPPAGIARLAGTLRRYGAECCVIDANLEALLTGFRKIPLSEDKWTSRAVKNLDSNLSSLRNRLAYVNPDQYKRAVIDLNRLLEISAIPNQIRLGWANYQDRRLSPARSQDLITASERPEENLFYQYFSKRLRDVVSTKPPSIIGISLNFLTQALCTFAMIGFLRKEYPELRIVLGGGLVTSWIRQPGWKNPFSGLVDNLIAGPGERALLSIIGIDFEQGEHCTPDYSTFPFKDYIAPGPILPYSASSGCYWNRCSFCPERAEGNPYIPIPRNRVKEDLNILVRRTSPVLLHLLDNAVSPALMEAFCADPPGVPWYGFARITHHFEDLDFCVALKRSGCIMLQLGLESGNQKVLDKEGKGMDLRVASKALKNIKQAGIATYVYLLFGTPSETVTEARHTLHFTAGHCESIDFLNLAIFNLPIHSPEAQQVRTQPVYEGDLSLYTAFSHPFGWDRSRVRQFLDKEFKRHPAIASILRNDPPFFTSNHAPFFNSTNLQRSV